MGFWCILEPHLPGSHKGFSLSKRLWFLFAPIFVWWFFFLFNVYVPYFSSHLVYFHPFLSLTVLLYTFSSFILSISLLHSIIISISLSLALARRVLLGFAVTLFVFQHHFEQLPFNNTRRYVHEGFTAATTLRRLVVIVSNIGIHEKKEDSETLPLKWLSHQMLLLHQIDQTVIFFINYVSYMCVSYIYSIYSFLLFRINTKTKCTSNHILCEAVSWVECEWWNLIHT